MKIKRLEMVGFKSFVDRTVVNFDHEVMAIVGPNGCGKSNIVDAIRWCMGEQSAKHLRGRSMDDVIFSGSESRAGHEFAEVTLTFENDRGDVPLEYKDFAEIAVTRRLDRSGESDYLINKTPVRLKDVTDLFLGTGAGTKAYSIVEQGKIGLIVSAKAEERRLLIEEAAGITKYKARKKQAERKMELTQQNLLRVGDIVAEIERNLDSLRRQAAKANRYLAYREELEQLQLHDASNKYLEAIGWIKLETGEVARTTAESDEARAALLVADAELETARQTAHDAEAVLDEAQNASFAAENEARTEEAAILRAKDRLEALRAREAQASGESADLGAQAARLAEEIRSVSEALEILEGQDRERAGVLSGHEASLAHVGQEHAAAERLSAGLRRESAEVQATIARAGARLEGFERRHGEMIKRRDKLALDHGEIDALLAEQRERERLSTEGVDRLTLDKGGLAAQEASLAEELRALRVRMGEAERALEEARAKLGRARSRMAALGEVLARREGVGQGARRLLAMKDPTVAGMLADRIDAPAEWIPALAGLLGGRLEDVVVRDISRGVDLLADLAKAGGGKATLVPLVARRVAGACPTLPDDEGVLGFLADLVRFAPEDEALVRHVVGDAIVVRDAGCAARLRAAGVTVALVTRDGVRFHEDGRVSGGAGEGAGAHMLETKHEVRELGAEVTRLDAALAEDLAAHQALRAEIAATQAGLEAARRSVHEGELALAVAARDQKSARGSVEQLTRRSQSVHAEVAELEAALAEAGVEKEAAERDRAEAEGRLADLSTRSEEADLGVAGWRAQLDAARVAVTEAKIALAGTREKLTAATGNRQRLTRSAEELAAREGRLTAELLENARAFGEHAAALVSHKERLFVALDVARDRAADLASARGEADALRADLGVREGALRDLRERADACRAALSRHEMSLRERQMGLEHLLASVCERFRGLDLTRVIGDYHLRPPPDEESRARANDLTTLLERMGSVNLDAVREHEEAEKRYTFYSEQKADLDKALADLERAIAQMNRESRRLFSETFEAVNERFRVVFPRMFRGGRAELKLTNPDDMLETGIDILAQPPGKKLSSIELMSGGEKALTAVSLIFAIFQFKPSPFCILDEVDAPLDEANVARYNELVRSMTDRSQFILITHIKRTMQSADVLHGVTMQESGVSRLVSVRLSAAADKRAPVTVEAVA